MARALSRRRFLLAGAALPVLGACRAGTQREPDQLRITVTGQALMTHPLCADPYPGLARVVAELRRGDIRMTGLEAPIRTAASGAPTRQGTFLHVAPPAVASCLREMGFDLLALSNNHAFDLGTEGILATRNAVAAAGFGHAGTGRDLAEATAAGFLPRDPRVALVAMAIGNIAEGGAATAERPGVNEVRMQDGAPHEEDVQRVLASIRAAATAARWVIVFLSNHAWGEDRSVTQPWARALARRCVDAGASLYLTHGAPLMHGIEIYRGRPLMHCLGSLVFHSRTPPGHYPPEAWESAIVHCDFDGDSLTGMEVVPVALNEVGDDPSRFEATRGRPRIAKGAARERILARIARMSEGLAPGLMLDPASGRVAR